MKNNTLAKAKFVEIEEEEEENKGFISSLFEKITGMFSLVQLKVHEIDNVENFSFTQIETKLQKMLTPTQQINFLITTVHEFEVVLNTLEESVKIYFNNYRNTV